MGLFDDIFAKYFEPEDEEKPSSFDDIFAGVSAKLRPRDLLQDMSIPSGLPALGQPDLPGNLSPIPGGMFTGDEPAVEDPEGNWYTKYLENVATSFGDNSIGGVLGLAEELPRAAFDQFSGAGRGASRIAFDKPIIGEDATYLRQALAENNQDAREASLDENPNLFGALTTLSADIGGMALEELLTFGAGAGVNRLRMADNASLSGLPDVQKLPDGGAPLPLQEAPNGLMQPDTALMDDLAGPSITDEPSAEDIVEIFKREFGMEGEPEGVTKTWLDDLAPEPIAALPHADEAGFSPEALNRVDLDQEYHRIDPGGQISPVLNSVDAVDVSGNPRDLVVVRRPDGLLDIQSSPESMTRAQQRAYESLSRQGQEIKASPFVEQVADVFEIGENDILDISQFPLMSPNYSVSNPLAKRIMDMPDEELTALKDSVFPLSGTGHTVPVRFDPVVRAKVPIWATSPEDAAARYYDFLEKNKGRVVGPEEVPFELDNIPLIRWERSLADNNPLRQGGTFWLIGDSRKYMQEMSQRATTKNLSPGGDTPRMASFTPENPLIVVGRYPKDFDASSRISGTRPENYVGDTAMIEGALISEATERGHDAIIRLTHGDVEVITTPLANLQPPSSGSHGTMETFLAIQNNPKLKSFAARAWRWPTREQIAQLSEALGIPEDDIKAFFRASSEYVPDDPVSMFWGRDQDVGGRWSQPSKDPFSAITRGINKIKDKFTNTNHPPGSAGGGGGDAGGGRVLGIDDMGPAPDRGGGITGIEGEIDKTPTDLKYELYGKRQVTDYEVAQENVRMKKEFSREQLEDATFYLEGTGNPLKGEMDSPDMVVARLRQTPEGLRLMHYVDTVWAEKTDKLHKAITDLGFDDVGYIENYIKHIWETDDLTAKRFTSSIKASDAFMKERKVKTYEAGIAAGMKPKTVNFADLVTITDRAYRNVIATQEMLADLRQMKAMPDGLPPISFGTPEKGSYVKVNIPAISKLATDDLTGVKPVYMHKDMYEALKPVITGTDVTKLDQAVSFVKASNLSFSLFHGATLFESAMTMFGPLQGIVRGVRGALGVPGLGRLSNATFDKVAQGAAAGAARAGDNLVGRSLQTVERVFGQPGIEVARDGMMHGLQIGRPETDVMQGAFFTALDKISKSVSGIPLAGRPAAAGIGGVKWLKKTFDTALWDGYHTPMKIAAYQHAVAKLTQAKNAKGVIGAASKVNDALGAAFKGRRLADMTDKDIKRTAAAFVNDEFGGQAWELINNKFWSDPKVTRVLRLVFTSPDWNVSSVRAATAAASSDPARRLLGERHYINAAIGYFAMMNFVNYQMSGHFMWDNEPGKEMHLETWYKTTDEKGRKRKVFWNVGKQTGEMAELVLGREKSDGTQELPVIGFLGRKILPIWQAMVASASGRTISGFPSKESQLAEELGRPLTLGERVGATARQFGEAMLPFNATRIDGDPENLPKLALPYPESRGMNALRAENLLYEAYTSGDSEAASEIINSLYENGYDSDSINSTISRAQRKALKEAYGTSLGED